MGSGASGASGVSGSRISGEPVDSSASGGSGDIILISGASEELISSEGSGEFLISEDLLISGDLSISEAIVGFATSGASGDLGSREVAIEHELPIGSGESGDHLGSGFSGDLSISGTSVSSGASGEPDESGDVEITLISGG